MTYYAGLTVRGIDSFDNLGRSVSSVGDMNGDGIDDFVVSAAGRASYGETRYSGVAYVVFGSGQPAATLDLSTTALDGTNGFQIFADRTNLTGVYDFYQLGQFASSAGDVNGDGIDDLIIGSQTARYGYDPVLGASARQNYQFVVFGKDTSVDGDFAPIVDVLGLDGTDGFAITDVDGMVTNVGSAGDINGDGFDDVFIGQSPVPNFSYGGPVIPRDAIAPGGDFAGFVLLGSSTIGATGAESVLDRDGTNGFGVQTERSNIDIGFYGEGGVPYGSYGGGIVAIGDVNGDGFDDLFVQTVVSQPYYDPAVGPYSYNRPITLQYILFGQDDTSTPFATEIDPTTLPPVAWANIQFQFPDFLVGGQPPNLSAALPNGFSSYEQRYAIAGIGDINGDGFDDVAISESNLNSVNNGTTVEVFDGGPVHILYGGPSGLDSNALDGVSDGLPVIVNPDGPSEAGAGFTLITSNLTPVASEIDSFGSAITGLGDVSGDGIDDFLIAASARFSTTFNSNPNVPTAYLVLGRDVAGGATPFADMDLLNLDPADAPGVYAFIGDVDDSDFARSIAGAGDVNDDGINDIVIGAEDADAGNFSGVGEAYVIFGGLTALEAADNADSSDDNVIDVANLDVDLLTGLTPIDISIEDANAFLFQNEGDLGATVFTYTVTRTGDTSLDVSVDFSVTGTSFSPADGADFVGGAFPSGTVMFAAGSTTATIDIEVAGDLDIESSDSFQIQLSNPVVSGAATLPPIAIVDATSFGRIFNDDRAPEISVRGTSVFEGDTAADNRQLVFTIERFGDSAAATGEVEVFYELQPGNNSRALLNADSADVVGTLPSGVQSVIIPAGASSVEVIVEIEEDLLPEPREEVDIVLLDFDDQGAGVDYLFTRTVATGVIINDDGIPPTIPDGGEADVYGDPHIVTLDGLGYDFQAVGEYVLVESAAGATNPFQVQVRFEPLPGSDLVSVTTRMAVEVGGSIVEIDALGSDEILVDGVAPADILTNGPLDLDGDLTPDVFYDGTMYIIVLNDTGEQLHIKSMDGVLNICVFLSSAAGGNAGAVQGLMGDNDGDISNDFALRDGSAIPATEISIDGTTGAPSLSFDYLYGRGSFAGTGYADSWEVDPAGTGAGKDSLFSNTDGNFPADFPVAAITLDDLPPETLALARLAAEAAGLDETNDPEIFNAAVLDFALTGDDDFLQGALGLAADPTASTAPTSAPTLPASFGVTPGETSVFEGDSGSQTVSFSIFRAGDTSDARDVDYAIGGDVDVSDLNIGSLTGTVSFAIGETSKTIDIEVAGDTTVEADEALTVSITNVSGTGALIAGQVGTTTILNDDSPPAIFSIGSDGFILEGDSGSTTINREITRTGNTATAANLEVTITGDVTADDLAPGTLFLQTVSFAPGETTKTLSFDILGDRDIEADEDMIVTLASVTGGPTNQIGTASATLEIRNDDLPLGISLVGPTIVAEGDAGSQVIEFTIDTGSNTVGPTTTVDLQISGDVDAADLAGGTLFTDSVTLNSGATTATFSVTVLGDMDVEADEVLTVSITGISGDGRFVASPTSASVTIENDDAAPMGVTIVGTNGPDDLVGTAFADSLSGLRGDDTLTGSDGNDTLEGGREDDTIDAGGGDDTILFVLGDDSIDGGADIDTLDIGPKAVLNSTDRIINVEVLEGGDLLVGGGADLDLSGFSVNNLTGRIRGDNAAQTITGTSDGDTIEGRRGDDSIDAGDGDDVVIGISGLDSLSGGIGQDTLDVGNSSTFLDGAFVGGFEILEGRKISVGIGATLDLSDVQTSNLTGQIVGDNGAQTIIGTQDDDTIFARNGADSIDAAGGNDLIVGITLGDQIDGGDGTDTLFIGNSATIGPATDVINVEVLEGRTLRIADNTAIDLSDFTTNNLTGLIRGTDGQQAIVGTSDNDIILGEGEDDAIDGSAGDDTIIGGLGNDALNGGIGSDTFVFQQENSLESIGDFELALDILDFAATDANQLSDLTITDITIGPAGALIEVGDLDVAVLDVTANDLINQATFIFV